ncbi:MAG: hypothetical protein A3I89_03245 [Candidatus Harrisonbacteria bacterium RIFCSPLOWO2_02_FULL_41_11]|uniref:Uncharacterized protein n=1 Tax=Candidatus Harrisonbacteria bacterium RIFCSPHIGHO2_02_FULL_42_16 TaxID=1798404 RepID=A0A1G1ZIM2_9BACT|nr:MAG: hypothetical protein A3B92_02735 [Candidatus Harrisonbacteria bacterium RIFCSPHIGHO2_02_FULL_42_16]OGY66254.1 MAG: hypothetical protein A3I89_03245 [Candidatus Harrisonbacteria bacterium RIFCSPLOWO2_02_FULL_41_11]
MKKKYYDSPTHWILLFIVIIVCIVFYQTGKERGYQRAYSQICWEIEYQGKSCSSWLELQSIDPGLEPDRYK